jgi:hypothetical protein
MTKRGDDQRAATEERLWALFEKIKAEGRPTGPTAFAKEAEISRPYLYRFTVLAAEVSAYGRQTQPKISRRGSGVTRTEAVKRGVDDQVRREHTSWAVEVEELRKRGEEDRKTIVALQESKQALEEEVQTYKRAYERLLLLAKEAGVSPSELEALQQRLTSPLRAIS